MQMDPVFEEKQYLGRNLQMLFVRLVFAIFCFAVGPARAHDVARIACGALRIVNASRSITKGVS